MISVAEALKLISNVQVQLSTETVNLSHAHNKVLAEQIVAPINLPPFDQSAMDGYAVCGIQSTYNVVGEIAAGITDEMTLNEGEAIRIFTGGAVPKNSTAVIMQEKTQALENNILQVDELVKSGQNIRPTGEQLVIGTNIFNKGHVINPATVGLLSNLGFSNVEVIKTPKINIIVTGNELVKPGTRDLKYGEIFESNSVMLESAILSKNFECSSPIQVEDNLDNTTEQIKQAFESHNVLIISGGISVGDYDYVKKALELNGVKEIFYKVKQKPGKPLFFGKKDNKFVFALPGNPAAALTCFYIYVLPLLKRLSGLNSFESISSLAPITKDYNRKSGRAVFLKARMDQGSVEILEGQSSAMLHSYALANGLAFLDENIESIKKGDKIKFYPL